MTLTMKDQVAVLLKQGWVSPVMALNVANCFSLSQRCGELAKEGHEIKKSWLELPSGKRVRIYRIEDKPGASN